MELYPGEFDVLKGEYKLRAELLEAKEALAAKDAALKRLAAAFVEFARKAAQ